eukprot:CAMPEP_0198204908 /NCGR_PEP_ID=MMETSP1445-20131203/8385_1 /TAXON_ID=36898 /ORGANISM="Pyramimonas sp., Strain CCMP2087" /LENGTH=441 /DNA_ID=CAMNT_0043876993 /DNA_START=115 /DNA_END=1437 /DNA_ORIENTATION=-
MADFETIPMDEPVDTPSEEEIHIQDKSAESKEEQPLDVTPDAEEEDNIPDEVEAGTCSTPEENGKKMGFRATLLAGYKTVKGKIPTAAITQAMTPIMTPISQALSHASSAVSQHIEIASQEPGFVASTVNFSKDVKDEAALLKERARLALDHPMNPMTTPLGPDPLLGVLPDEAIPKEAEGLRKHIEEFARCKDFWIQLLDQMTEYYRSSTHLQQAEASLARLLIVASNAEKDASAAAMASMAAAHKAEEKAHTDVNANGYKMVVEPIETFIKHALNDTAVTIYKYESTRKVCGLELLNKVKLENRGPRKEKQVTVSEGKLAALEKEMLNAAECALMKMMMLEGKAKVQLAQVLGVHMSQVAELQHQRAGAFFECSAWTKGLQTDASHQADRLLGEMQDAVTALKASEACEPRLSSASSSVEPHLSSASSSVEAEQQTGSW